MATPENKPTVLLIEPPFYRLFKPTYSLDRYPLSLGYLAEAVLRETDYQPVVLNADFVPAGEMIEASYLAGQGAVRFAGELLNPTDAAWGEADALLIKYNPAVVAITAKTQNFPAAAILAARIKENCPDTLVVLGGPQASLADDIALTCPAIDLTVRGEGEATFVDLLKTLATGEPWEDIPGISYRCDGEIVRTPDRPLIQDLDALGFPHAHAADVLVNYSEFPREAFGNVFAIRGCPFACYYCGSRNIWTRNVRFRSPQHVADELASLKRMGLTCVHFDDDTFGVKRSYILELCAAIRKRSGKISWSCELHANLVDDEVLAAMKAAGCYRIQLGVESGSDVILKAMRKQTTIAETISACKKIRAAGLELHIFLMLGFPQETEETLAETLAAVSAIAPDRANCSIYTPYPGTEAWDDAIAAGLISPAEVSLSHQRPGSPLCKAIAPERFAEMALEIEMAIESLNAAARRRELLSLRRLGRNIHRAFSLGPKACLVKLSDILHLR